MRETGRVTRKTGYQLVEVELKQSADCAKCGVCHFGDGGTMLMEARDETGVSVGDTVEISAPESSVIMASFLLFLFPLIAFFAGYLIRGAILGVLSLAVYLVFLFLYDRSVKPIPKVTRVLSNQ